LAIVERETLSKNDYYYPVQVRLDTGEVKERDAELLEPIRNRPSHTPESVLGLAMDWAMGQGA
jgi:hypothetical protein